MLQQVNAGNKSLADYRSIARRELYEEIRGLSSRLEGVRVLHINATSFGGGSRRSCTLWCTSCATRASTRTGR